MNTKTFQTLVQARVCHKLMFLEGNRGGYTHTDLTQEVSRQCNRLLIELGLNHSLWSRTYRDRLFIYHIQTRRAVLELGVVTKDTGSLDPDGKRLYRGFELVLLGGIYNQRVITDLASYTIAKPLNRRK